MTTIDDHCWRKPPQCALISITRQRIVKSRPFFGNVAPLGVIARLDPKSGLPDFGTY
jgi:hypothetical protein